MTTTYTNHLGGLKYTSDKSDPDNELLGVITYVQEARITGVSDKLDIKGNPIIATDYRSVGLDAHDPAAFTDVSTLDKEERDVIVWGFLKDKDKDEMKAAVDAQIAAAIEKRDLEQAAIDAGTITDDGEFA
jgi:hypothetical protein